MTITDALLIVPSLETDDADCKRNRYLLHHYLRSVDIKPFG